MKGKLSGKYVGLCRCTHTHTHWEVCPRIITSQSSTRSCRQEISQVTLLQGGEITDPDTVKIITEYESEYEYEYDDDD